MNNFSSTTLFVLAAGLVLAGCWQTTPPKEQSEAASSPREAAAPDTTAEPSGGPALYGPGDTVTGRIRGGHVTMTGADLKDQLAIYEGEGWGFNPSLLIFFFGDLEGDPAGRTMTVTADSSDSAMRAHVHYRWKNQETGQIELASVMNGYNLTLTFGQPADGHLPGTIEFSVPGEDTSVSGSFNASLESPP